MKYAPALVIPALVGMISLPILTRLFPPQEYGYYTLVVSTNSILLLLLGWLPMSIVRFYPSYEKENIEGVLIRTAMTWLWITVAALTLIYGLSVYFLKVKLPQGLREMFLVGVVLFAVASLSEFLKVTLRARRLAGSYSFFQSLSSLAGLGFGLILSIASRLGMKGMLWGQLLSTALVIPIMIWVALPRDKKGAFSASLSCEMFRYGMPLVVGNLAAWILSLSDRYMLGIFRGPAEVGIYSASYTISERSIYLVITWYLLSAGPIGFHVFEKDGPQSARSFLAKLTRNYLMIGVPLVFGLSALSRPLVEVFVGKDYVEGFKIIPIVTAGTFLLGLQQRFQSGLTFYKRTVWVMVSIFTAGLVNVMLNLIFIPRYGYMAASVTTLVGYGVLLAMIVATSRRYFRWPFPWRSLVKILVGSAVMASLVFALNLTNLHIGLRIAISVPLGIGTYFCFLFLFKEITPKDVRDLLSTLGIRRAVG